MWSLALCTLALAALSCVACAPPASLADLPGALIFETFEEGISWVPSSNDKYDGKFTVSQGELKVPAKDKHYGLTALLPEPLDPAEGLVVQYEATFSKGYSCGGAYVKLLTHVDGFKADELVDTTPYTIMFGPDKCGDPSGKIHMILRHRNPNNGVITEHHLKPQPAPVTDDLPHVYTLIIKPDNEFQVLVDGEIKSFGPLHERLEPPINTPKEVPDPEDVKPSDWVDAQKIPDPDATQPEDWDMRPEIVDTSAKKPSGWLDDEPDAIPDPTAKRPTDWDDDEDGEWEAPIIPNPKCKRVGCGEWKQPMKKNPAYKGPWSAPLIDNPEYKGPWVQKTIPNPDFFEDEAPLTNIGKIGAIAFEIWTIDEGYQFDNIYVGKDAKEATRLRNELWRPKFDELKEAAAAKAKAEAEEAERKRKAALEEKKAKQAKQTLTENMAEYVLDAFETGPLQSFKSNVQPVLDAVKRSPSSVWALLGAPLVCIATLLVVLSKPRNRPAQRHSAAARRAMPKAPEGEGGEDKGEEEEEEAEAEAGDGATAKETKEAAAEAKEEEINAEADEDEGDEKAAVRRRARRA